MIETSDGGYAIAGSWMVVKTDMYGNMEWNQTYGGESGDYARSLVATSDGGYALAGHTSSFGAGSTDFWLVKTDAQGIPEFPSWIILPLFLTASLMVLLFKKRMRKN